MYILKVTSFQQIFNHLPYKPLYYAHHGLKSLMSSFVLDTSEMGVDKILQEKNQEDEVKDTQAL